MKESKLKSGQKTLCGNFQLRGPLCKSALCSEKEKLMINGCYHLIIQGVFFYFDQSKLAIGNPNFDQI